MNNLQPQELFANRYRLIEKIGAGGFSEVWKAVDEMALETEVALKIYAPDKGLDQNGIKQFRREYALTQPLDNPYLLKASHFAVETDSPYLVMPLCERGSLQNLFFDLGQLDELQIARIMEQIGGALAYIHSHDILHQDIKPDNILINKQGDYLLTDFGISVKMRGTLQKATSISRAVTLAYSPPEKYASRPRSLPAGDVFALGVMLYELITGEVPWNGYGGMVLLKGAVVPDLPPSYSENLNYALKACMHPQPGERPSARQLTRLGYHYIRTGIWEEIDSISDEPLEEPVFIPNPSKTSETPISSGRVTQALDPDQLDFDLGEIGLVPAEEVAVDRSSSIVEVEPALELDAEIDPEFNSESNKQETEPVVEAVIETERPEITPGEQLSDLPQKKLKNGRKRKGVLIASFSALLALIGGGVWWGWPAPAMSVIQASNGDWGYLNAEGFLAIPHQFSSAGPMIERRAIVELGAGIGIIDEKGNWIFPPSLDEAHDFVDGLARAKVGSKYGYLDRKGRWAIDPQYFDATDFLKGKALVESGGRFGFLNTNGGWSIEPTWEYAEQFSEDLALVSIKGLYGFIALDGEVRIPCQYSEASSFQNGRALILRDGKYGYIDASGTEVIDAIFEEAQPFSENFALVRRDSLYEYIDIDGKVISNESYEIGKAFSGGYASVYRKGKWALINQDGKQVSDWYQKIEVYEDGRWIVQEKGKEAYLNSNGTRITPWYDEVFPLYCGLARVRSGDQYGYIDSLGKEVVPPSYSDATDLVLDRAWVKKRNRYALIDASGSQLTDFEYQKIGEPSSVSTLMPVLKGDGWEFLDITTARSIHKTWKAARPYVGNWAAVLTSTAWNFVDRDGQLLFADSVGGFDEVKDFIVGLNGSWGRKATEYYYFLDDGKIVGPYDWIDTVGRNDLLVVSQHGKVALMDMAGVLVTDFTFDEIGTFVDGIAKVRNGDNFQFLTSKGKLLSEEWYEEVGEFQGGLTWVKKNRFYGMLNSDGKEIFPPKLEQVEILENGFASVREEGNYAIVDRNGRVLHSNLSRVAFLTSQGIAGVANEGKYGLLSIHHGMITDYTFQRIYPFSGGLAESRQEGLYGFLNKKGEWEIEPTYEFVGQFYRGVSVVSKTDGYALINRKGEAILDGAYADIGEFDQALPYSWIEKEGSFALIDLKGNIRTEWYDEIEVLTHIGFLVSKSGKRALVDSEGTLLSAWYDKIGNLAQGRILVQNNSLYGYIDIRGEEIVPCQYDFGTEFLNNRAIVKSGGQNFFIDQLGIKISDTFEDMEPYWQGYARIRKDGAYGYVDESGNLYFDQLQVFVHLYGVDKNEEYRNTLQAIGAHFQNADFNESATSDTTILEQKLQGNDVLLLPEFENGDMNLLPQFAPIYQQFVKEGGRVIICGSNTSRANRVLEIGLWEGEFLGFTQKESLSISNPTHPIAFSMPKKFPASNATYYYRLIGGEPIVELGEGQTVVSVKQIGEGKSIYIGFDFYEYNPSASRLISNIFRWILLERIQPKQQSR